MKTTIYQREHPYRISAGGGIRTLKLFRAPAPKADMFANFITPAAVLIVPPGASKRLVGVSS
jgi:hypothetical protein